MSATCRWNEAGEDVTNTHSLKSGSLSPSEAETQALSSRHMTPSIARCRNGLLHCTMTMSVGIPKRRRLVVPFRIARLDESG